MDKREACHKLADINEEMYELEELLSDVESALKWCDEDKISHYQSRRDELSRRLEQCKRKHDDFISMYSDIIYS